MVEAIDSMVDSSGEVLDKSMVQVSGQSYDTVSPTGDTRNVIVVSSNKNLKSYSPSCFDYQVATLHNTKTSSVYVDNYDVNACPINVTRFKVYLQGYDKAKYDQLIKLISLGAEIPSLLAFDPDRLVPPNQKSTIEYFDLVNELICKELLAKRIAGPFIQSPPGLIVSPLGAVPKKEQGRIRIIHNQSYPLNQSVNSNIPREYCGVEYQLIDV